MVFASYEFIYLFLPIVLITYFTLSKFKSIKIQHIFLVLASLFFYGYFNLAYLAIIIASIIVNYTLAKLILVLNNNKGYYSKGLFILGILFNIGMLGYFKYYDFFVSNINLAIGTDFVLKHILLPLGISFFTFQQFSFLLEVYKGKGKVENFIDYCLFVTFFPQLVAGPIVLYSEMIPQFKEEKRRYINYNNFAKGIYIFCIGLFKKIVIADTVALFVNNGFVSSNMSFAVAWATALSYTLQIYFDFSGYSDIAIGIGKMFNIDLPINFNSPYKSESITEFWKRWHMTLGRALSTYIYKPLGGNRKGLMRTCINLFITFIVSGLWHGAAWTFIIWGSFHGLIIVFERIFINKLTQIPRGFRIAGTFFCVNALWVLFRSTSFQNAMMVYQGMMNVKNIGVMSIANLTVDGIVGIPTIIGVTYVVGIVLMLLGIVFTTKNTIERAEKFKYNLKTMVFISVLFVLSTIHLSRLSTFIYFNF